MGWWLAGALDSGALDSHWGAGWRPESDGGTEFSFPAVRRIEMSRCCWHCEIYEEEEADPESQEVPTKKAMLA